MWNSEFRAGNDVPQSEVIVKLPEPSEIPCSSFSIVLISSTPDPRGTTKPGFLNVTVPPLSTAVPSRTVHDGAIVPPSNSPTTSNTPWADPNSLPSTSKRSHDELKVRADDDPGRRVAMAKTAPMIHEQRAAERMGPLLRRVRSAVEIR